MAIRDSGLSRRGVVAGGFALAALRSAAWAQDAVGPMMRTLSEYMAAARSANLPANTALHAKLHILDTFAAMISGAELAPGRAAIAYARLYGGTPIATVAAARLRCTPAEAAFANGVMAQADETDDSHAPSQSHPGCAVVPAALATAEALGADGAHFLRAVALGYDVGVRMMISLGGVAFRDASHRSTHSIAGGFGAAAAAGCVARLNAQQMRFVLDYAAQQSSGIASWSRDVDHIEKSFTFGGMTARSGVTAALLVHTGWTGVDDVFSGADNFFQAYAPNANPALVVEALGQRWEITRTDIKRWSVGSPIQAPLDALNSLMVEGQFGAQDVREVVVRLAASSIRTVDGREMPDVSLQHMIAVMLLDHTASFHAAHDKARMTDPAILAERKKIKLVADDELQKLLPQRVAIVQVNLADGRTLSNRVDTVRGTAGNPMSPEEVTSKARDLIEPVLGAGNSERLIAATMALETQKDMRTVARLLSPALERR